ncbi:MAG: 50S ribosomal protein L35 [Proteobacteria bacterium]|nr:50S ribosomal protein L35 [Pseudomonadota bacterium]MBI3498282.1 50S ribosomal protein L35 [Pseudomonadota bacterium]
MPKMKTKSGAKKRFSMTGTGKIKLNPSRKRHGLSNRPQKMKRQARGPEVMSERDMPRVRKFFLPNGL